ncbi:GIY-YIG nuclease family protein [Acetobacterium sp.]|uniref:GIY-YIG nuclease family protein n=1 Tax=Acetobacterium sp. TaxID=1872094 RepID=UPI003593A8D0
MFGTIILDAYKSDELEIMANFIDEICSPMDTVGWASAGIYSFWEYDTKEILYIGLASDLCVRFKQHNGLLPIDDSACKYLQIQDYFKTHKKLGYTILVQSPLSQPIVQRNEKMYRIFLEKPKGIAVGNYVGEEGLEHIKLVEGQLIEAYRLFTGDIPPWNKIGGNTYARKFATKGNFLQIIQAFSSGDTHNLLISRSTLRELANNATYEWFEVQLHALRMMMLTMGYSYQDALDFQLTVNPDFQIIFDRLKDENYVQKELIV